MGLRWSGWNMLSPASSLITPSKSTSPYCPIDHGKGLDEAIIDQAGATMFVPL